MLKGLVRKRGEKVAVGCIENVSRDYSTAIVCGKLSGLEWKGDAVVYK